MAIGGESRPVLGIIACYHSVDKTYIYFRENMQSVDSRPFSLVKPWDLVYNKVLD